MLFNLKTIENKIKNHKQTDTKSQLPPQKNKKTKKQNKKKPKKKQTKTKQNKKQKKNSQQGNSFIKELEIIDMFTFSSLRKELLNNW